MGQVTNCKTLNAGHCTDCDDMFAERDDGECERICRDGFSKTRGTCKAMNCNAHELSGACAPLKCKDGFWRTEDVGSCKRGADADQDECQDNLKFTGCQWQSGSCKNQACTSPCATCSGLA